MNHIEYMHQLFEQHGSEKSHLKKRNKAELHKEICCQLTDMYVRKNGDYGDAFGQSLKEHGLIASIVRMEDKFNRFKNLSNKQGLVNDETVEDTLLDLANYAIMTVIELRGQGE